MEMEEFGIKYFDVCLDKAVEYVGQPDCMRAYFEYNGYEVNIMMLECDFVCNDEENGGVWNVEFTKGDDKIAFVYTYTTTPFYDERGEIDNDFFPSEIVIDMVRYAIREKGVKENGN